MKPLSTITTATAITFAAGIALMGTGDRPPTERRARKDPNAAKTTQRGVRKAPAELARMPIDPTLAHASFTGALTSARANFR